MSISDDTLDDYLDRRDRMRTAGKDVYAALSSTRRSLQWGMEALAASPESSQQNAFDPVESDLAENVMLAKAHFGKVAEDLEELAAKLRKARGET